MPKIKFIHEYWESNPSNIKYTYKEKSTGYLWNAEKINGNVVKLWTENAWGSFYHQSVDIYRFKVEYEEYNSKS